MIVNCPNGKATEWWDKMKIDDILKRELKDSEFIKNYRTEKKRSARALALCYAREEAELAQAELNCPKE